MKPKTITVEPSAEHPDILDVRDAMQHVMDFFDLHTDQGIPSVVWNLTFASVNSPFTVAGSPVDLRTNAAAFSLISPHVEKIERGFERIQAGEPLDADFPIEKRGVVARFLERNKNGIGLTKFNLWNGDNLELESTLVQRFLDVVQDTGDEEYDYFFATFARKEIGAIEGRITDLSTDYDEPAIKLKEHRTGREIQCRVSAEARNEIEDSLTAGDVWTHRRIRVRGTISYDATGKIVRIYDGRIAYIDPNEVSVADLKDANFTGGMPVYEYIDRLRENDFG